MKRVTLVVVFIAFLFGTAGAGNAWLFEYDELAITETFAELTALEQQLEGISELPGEAAEAYNALVSYSTFPFDDIRPPLGIPSFLWGFVLGPVGILIVHLAIKENPETRKAFYGCFTVSVASVAGVLIYLITRSNSSSGCINVGC